MRTFDSGFSNALDDGIIRPFYLFEINLGTTTLNLWSGDYSLSWDSKTWLGNGWFQGLSSIKERSGRSSSIEIALTGVTSDVMSLILVDLKQGAQTTLSYGLFNTSWGIITDPITLFSGLYDQSRISDSIDSSQVSLSFNSNLSRLSRRFDLRYTDAAQKNLFPTDQGLEYVASLADWKGYIGVKK